MNTLYYRVLYIVMRVQHHGRKTVALSCSYNSNSTCSTWIWDGETGVVIHRAWHGFKAHTSCCFVRNKNRQRTRATLCGQVRSACCICCSVSCWFLVHTFWYHLHTWAREALWYSIMRWDGFVGVWGGDDAHFISTWLKSKTGVPSPVFPIPGIAQANNTRHALVMQAITIGVFVMPREHAVRVYVSSISKSRTMCITAIRWWVYTRAGADSETEHAYLHGLREQTIILKTEDGQNARDATPLTHALTRHSPAVLVGVFLDKKLEMLLLLRGRSQAGFVSSVSPPRVRRCVCVFRLFLVRVSACQHGKLRISRDDQVRDNIWWFAYAG